MSGVVEKNKGGRPPIFNTANELQDLVDDYFNNGVNIKKVLVGKVPNQVVEEIPVPTITGLTLHCGFASRQSFYDLEKNDKFSYIIKRARTFIENHYEELLQVGNTTGAIFALKNMSWSDKQEIDHKNDGGKFDSNTYIQNSSTDDLVKRAESIKIIEENKNTDIA